MKKELWILTAIIILAGVLRFFSLGTNPPGLNWDEVSHGYNAYSILKTGQDEWGQFFPLTNFRAYGDYPLPLYMYLAMPGIALFGLGEFTARIPSAFFGSLLVLLTYLLSKRILKNSRLSLLSAFLLAISPWSMMISRQVLQATPAIFFLALGVWLFLKGVSEKKYWTILGATSMGISAYGYHNTRILAPLIFLALVFFYRKILFENITKFVATLVVAALFFVPLVFILTSGQGSARSSWVGILDQGAINRINEARGLDQSLMSRLQYNKVTYFISTAAGNYLSYFTPRYLALEGGTQYQYSVPHFGVINPVELPFFYIGLLVLLLGFTKLPPERKFLLVWLLLAPLPAAVSRDPYQVIRSTTMLPAIFLVSALGFLYFLNFLRSDRWRKITVVVFLLAATALFTRYLHNLWFIYPNQYSFAWQYGYKQVAQYIEANGDKYADIFITKKYGEPHEFMLFYLRYNPASYRNDPNLVRYGKSNWFWVDGFDRYHFINDWEVLEKTSNRGNLLLVTSPGNYPTNGRLIETIYFLSGEPAFDIVRI